MAQPRYSIIIPAYNESRRILPTLERVVNFVRQQRWNAEVVVVNDGSKDDTAAVVSAFATRNPELRMIENPGNRGKGFAVRNGMMQAAGEILLFTDADLSSPIEEADRLIAAIDKGADVAIGSRWLDPSMQTERQPLYRQFFGRCFNLFMRMVLGLNVTDTQCGFKAFTRAAAREIFPRQQITGWAFDPELLFIAKKLKFRISEVAVHWAHDDRTTIKYFSAGRKMLGEILSIRMNGLKGVYDRKAEVETIAAAS